MSRILTLVFLLACVVPVHAHVLHGSLVGNVVDPTQGAVPAAAVTVANTATGWSAKPRPMNAADSPSVTCWRGLTT